MFRGEIVTLADNAKLISEITYSINPMLQFYEGFGSKIQEVHKYYSLSIDIMKLKLSKDKQRSSPSKQIVCYHCH